MLLIFNIIFIICNYNYIKYMYYFSIILHIQIFKIYNILIIDYLGILISKIVLTRSQHIFKIDNKYYNTYFNLNIFL